MNLEEKREFLKQELLKRGYKEEDIMKVLTQRGYYSPEEEPKEEKPKDVSNMIPKKPSFKGKAYCFQCKQPVTVINGEISKKEIKPNSYRTFLRGNCSRCNRKVFGVVKSSSVGRSDLKNSPNIRHVP